MKHKNMKQYEEKNDPMLNHDITLEEIEAACRAHQKENDNRNMAEECRAIAREQKEKMQAQFQKERVKSVISCFALAVICGSLKAGCFLPSC